MNISDQSELEIKEIKRRTALFVQDNFNGRCFTSQARATFLIESAMLIGASISSEIQIQIFFDQS